MVLWSGERVYRHCRQALLTTAAGLLLAGCTSSFNLQTQAQVPTPVVSQLPLTMGIYYDDNFRHYVYEENTDDRKNWHIDNSKSRIALFQQILPSMFQKVQEVSGTSATAGEQVDAILSPQVEEMQLSLPKETYSDLYEAWIRYKIQLFQPDGELIAEWPLTGYGKAEKGFFNNRSKGLNSAIDQALRDIGAKLAIGFSKQEAVRRWLDGRNNVYHAEAGS
jgi:hypothetical protein